MGFETIGMAYVGGVIAAGEATGRATGLDSCGQVVNLNYRELPLCSLRFAGAAQHLLFSCQACGLESRGIITDFIGRVFTSMDDLNQDASPRESHGWQGIISWYGQLPDLRQHRFEPRTRHRSC